jgi:hypothetical protein
MTTKTTGDPMTMSPTYPRGRTITPDLDALVKAIEDQPVWIDDPQSEGNAATSRAYRNVLGIDCANWSWKECVLNPEYVESYRAWRDRGPTDEQWVYPIKWRRPDTGQVLDGYSRANWTPTGLIVGSVTIPPRSTKLPRWGFLFLVACLLFAGFVAGFLAAAS